MHQAAVLDGSALDAHTVQQDGLPPAEIGIGGGQVAQAFVVALVVVSLDKRGDLSLQRTQQVVILEQDAVLHGLVPAFDLALGLRMRGRAADMLNALLGQPPGKSVRDEPRPVIREQSRALAQRHIAAARGGHGQFQRLTNIARRHASAKPPGDDVAGEVIQHRAEIKPPPADDLEIGEIRLPNLIGRVLSP